MCENIKKALRFTITAILIFSACGGPTFHDSAPAPDLKPTNCVMWQGVQHEGMPCDWHGIFDQVGSACLAFPWGTYGRANACLQGFTEARTSAHLHVYASNGVCIRNRNCGPQEAVEMPAIVSRAIEIIEFLAEHCPGCSADIVVQLEDQLHSAEACHIAGRIREAIKLLGVQNEIAIYRNPVRADLHDSISAACFDGIELHNAAASETGFAGMAHCAWSNDGADLLVGNTRWSDQPVLSSEAALQAARRFNACTAYFWAADGNCLSAASWLSPIPPNRECAAVDPGTITDLNALLRELEG